MNALAVAIRIAGNKRWRGLFPRVRAVVLVRHDGNLSEGVVVALLSELDHRPTQTKTMLLNCHQFSPEVLRWPG